MWDNGIGSGQIPTSLVSHCLVTSDGYKVVKQYGQSWWAEKSGVQKNAINKRESKVLPHRAQKGALQRGICLFCLFSAALCTRQKSTGDNVLSGSGPADSPHLSKSILAVRDAQVYTDFSSSMWVSKNGRVEAPSTSKVGLTVNVRWWEQSSLVERE